MKRFERLTKLHNLAEFSKKYHMEKKTIQNRLERHGVKGYQIGRLAYYPLNEEVDRILSKPVEEPVREKKEKGYFPENFRLAKDDLDMSITVDCMA